MPENILFDLETLIKQWLGLMPSTQIQAKKPEPEKVEPTPQPSKPATESPTQKPSQTQPSKTTPQSQTVGKPRIAEAI
jgi:BRCT domain type II-containing protein